MKLNETIRKRIAETVGSSCNRIKEMKEDVIRELKENALAIYDSIYSTEDKDYMADRPAWHYKSACYNLHIKARDEKYGTSWQLLMPVAKLFPGHQESHWARSTCFLDEPLIAKREELNRRAEDLAELSGNIYKQTLLALRQFTTDTAAMKALPDIADTIAAVCGKSAGSVAIVRRDYTELMNLIKQNQA